MSFTIYITKKIYLRIFKKDLQKEILPYRVYLFEELVKQFSKSYFQQYEYFRNWSKRWLRYEAFRILESGKDNSY